LFDLADYFREIEQSARGARCFVRYSGPRQAFRARAESDIMGRLARPIASQVPRSFLDDIRYLLRHVDIASADEATSVVMRYFDGSQILPKTRLILEKILGR
jgi:hypothetical protein